MLLLDFYHKYYVYISNDSISGFDNLMTILVQTCYISCTLDWSHVKCKGNKPDNTIDAPVSASTNIFVLKNYFLSVIKQHISINWKSCEL